MTGTYITISNSEKLSFLSNFATMLKAGIPILEAVDSLLEDSKGNLKKILTAIREDLSQGKHVYTAFSQFPSVFDEIIINIVRASEEGGTLETALRDLRDITKKEIEFTDKIRSALLYPLFIIVVFIAILTLILTFVIPKIATVFSRLRIEMPLPTKILIFLSNAILHYTIPIVVSIAAAVVIFIFIYKRNKRGLIRAIASLPLIRKLSKEIDLTRLSRCLYLLLSSGVPIVAALELSKHVVMSSQLATMIEKSHEMILSGKRLSEGFKNTKGQLPALMIKIIEAGERTGSLEASMNEIAEYLDYQVSKTLVTLTALIEPILLIVIGVLVGGMMFSIVGPIYGLISQIGSR